MSQPSTRTAIGAILPTGLMLFALFFGAGNLIFPPLLGAASGRSFIPVMVGFLATGVLMPLITVVAASTSGEGILGLARRVGPRFGTVMPLAVYLAIGPLYAIARVTTVAYELATRPVLELLGIQDSRLALLVHVTVFMGVSFSIARSPSRLADRVGRWLTPALLALLALLCGVTIAMSPRVEREAIEPYASDPLTNGLTQGYLTMDVLAATVFGIVVITSLRERGLTSPRALVRSTILSGGIAAALLLNPVTLQPGEALFVPAGSVHAYISGLGVEVMASSDNVLRAGLSAKHIDVPEMLACVDYVAAPPVRPAPEYLSRATRAYYAPVDDFELMVTTVVAADGRLPVPGRGPRILLAVEGAMTLVTQADTQTLAQGEAVFVGADERSLSVEGEGTLVQADVP